MSEPETTDNRIRILFSRLKEEHEWTMHMLLDIRRRLDRMEAILAEFEPDPPCGAAGGSVE